MARKPRVYVLTRDYAGTVMEVGTDSTPDQKQYVVLSLPQGQLRLQGLTMDEARACGAHLYRPTVIRVEVVMDDGIKRRKKGV